MADEADRRRIPFGRLGGELVLIVVGVLLALQAEAWAERRNDRSREESRLRELRADFEVNAMRLDSIIDLQQRTVDAVATAIAWAEGEAPDITPDSLRVLVAWANSFQRFTPVTGGYDALIASGDLRLLRNAELKVKLASFSRAAVTGYQDAASADLVRTELVRRGAQVVRLWRVIPPAYLGMLGYRGSPPPGDAARLFDDAEYMGLLLMTGFAEAWHLGFFRQLERDAKRILELLAAELEP